VRIRKKVLPSFIHYLLSDMLVGSLRDFALMEDVERQYLQEVKQEILSNPDRWQKLNVRERDLLRVRLGLDDELFRDSFSVAQLFGLSVLRVAQIEAKALSKFREQ